MLHNSHANQDVSRRLRERFEKAAHFVDPSRSLQKVVAEISSRTRLLTSSPRGLVAAGADGILAACSLCDPALLGGSFKFEDYELVVEPLRGRRVGIDEMQSVEHVRRAFAHVSRAAFQLAVIGLKDSISTLKNTTWKNAAVASRLWRQHKYLLPSSV